MNPCEQCGAKPGRGGVILRHKKGCVTLSTTSPRIPEESMILEAEKLMGIIPAPPTKKEVVKQCFTCVCCVKPWSGMHECHRYPPSGGQWARVGPGDWCKEWEQKGE